MLLKILLLSKFFFHFGRKNGHNHLLTIKQNAVLLAPIHTCAKFFCEVSRTRFKFSYLGFYHQIYISRATHTKVAFMKIKNDSCKVMKILFLENNWKMARKKDQAVMENITDEAEFNTFIDKR